MGEYIMMYKHYNQMMRFNCIVHKKTHKLYKFLIICHVISILSCIVDICHVI